MMRTLVYPPSSRPVVMGTEGMVSSGNPLASMAGVRTLNAGGNAFDAAAAVAFTLGVVEPYHSGPGGTGSALVRCAGESRSRVLDFSGCVPAAADPAQYNDARKDLGVLAPLVPGNVAGWLELQGRHGALELERVLQPAIDYAENGFPITYQNSAVIAEFAARLRPFPSAAILLDRDGRAPAPGARHRCPQLAASLRLIAQQGRDVFYRGELAQRMVRAVQQLGGVLTMDDFASYQPLWQDPLSIDYRGYQVFAPPLPSCAFQTLAHLKLMECFGADELLFQSADTVHALIEAAKLCVTDRIAWAGDPRYIESPLQTLLSPHYAAAQRERIDMDAAAVVGGESYNLERPPNALAPGLPQGADGGNTTHFEVADRAGNVVGITQTLGGYFGCAAAFGDSGIFLNNMMIMADTDEGAPNCLAAGRRLASPLAPTQTFRDGRLVLSLGMPGGWAILQRTVQILLNFLDFGMNVQQAIEAPQFRMYGGREVHFEERLPVQVRRELEARGHQLTVLEGWSLRVSGAQAIQLDAESGLYLSGCDTRRDGFAIGL